jgi:hypothetical protein
MQIKTLEKLNLKITKKLKLSFFFVTDRNFSLLNGIREKLGVPKKLRITIVKINLSFIFAKIVMFLSE